MSFTGMSPDRKFVEIIELHEDHPWFLGCQFHPELKSKPFACHPLFKDFIRAARAHRAARERDAEAEAVAGRRGRRRGDRLSAVRDDRDRPGLRDRRRRAAALLRRALRHRVAAARARDGRAARRRSPRRPARGSSSSRPSTRPTAPRRTRSAARASRRASTSSPRSRRRRACPLLSDVHEPEQAEAAARVLDVLQIPAFLSRQTDLLIAAAKTGKPLNVKKGQFMAPDDMGSVVEKCRAAGNEKLLLCERGTSFGYHNLVVDMRSFPIMRALGYPSSTTSTHSLQLPGGGKETGGLKQYAPMLARAAAATGCVDGFFLEVHDDPDRALSDRSTQLDVRLLPDLIRVAHRGVARESRGRSRP